MQTKMMANSGSMQKVSRFQQVVEIKMFNDSMCCQ